MDPIKQHQLEEVEMMGPKHNNNNKKEQMKNFS
jgi:hypothetical protein